MNRVQTCHCALLSEGSRNTKRFRVTTMSLTPPHVQSAREVGGSPAAIPVGLVGGFAAPAFARVCPEYVQSTTCCAASGAKSLSVMLRIKQRTVSRVTARRQARTTPFGTGSCSAAATAQQV